MAIIGESTASDGFYDDWPEPDKQLRLRSEDHPEANGRNPIPGEQAWTLRIPLEDGRTLLLCLGAKTRRVLRDMILEEELDNALEASEVKHLV